MADAKGIKAVGYVDCVGGGQVVVQDGLAFVGHMRSPDGTSIIDVRDPKKPKLLASLGMPQGTHSHKVRVHGEIMVVNHEITRYDTGAPADFRGGLGIYNIGDPSKPRQLCRWETAGQGVHRFDFDGRYLYISPTYEGYVGNIVMILDVQNPERPEEVGRWWMPGQWTAGGETPSWEGTHHRCHHPLRMGNRLYTSYWFGGFVILDIEDMTKPRIVSGLDWSPPFVCPTHTALPVPFEVNGRRVILVADEDVHRPHGGFPAFLSVVDVTDETRPTPLGSFQVDAVRGPQPDYTACHQPCEKVTGTEIPAAWFAQGLRVIDIANPNTPREAAYFVPDVPPGSDRVQSNDVTVDDAGLIYLLDRRRGLNILERA